MKEQYRLRVGLGVMAIGLVATFGACSDSSPMSPSSNSAATVTITATGVTPQQVSVGINGTEPSCSSTTTRCLARSTPTLFRLTMTVHRSTRLELWLREISGRLDD